MVKKSSSSSVSTERLPSERSSDSKYKGVRKRKWGKWVSEIRLPNSRERIWLGSYDTPEKAARAFDAALYCLRGETAKFNFPDNPPEIPGGRSLNPSEIQAAASRFANSGQASGSSHLDHSSSSSSEPEAESPYSDTGAPQVEQETSYQVDNTSSCSLDTTFLNHFATMGSDSGHYNNNMPDYGIFPGFDDFTNDFYMPPPPLTNNDYSNNGYSNDFYMPPPPLPNNDYAEDNYDAQHPSFLWNF